MAAKSRSVSQTGKDPLGSSPHDGPEGPEVQVRITGVEVRPLYPRRCGDRSGNAPVPNGLDRLWRCLPGLEVCGRGMLHPETSRPNNANYLGRRFWAKFREEAFPRIRARAPWEEPR